MNMALSRKAAERALDKDERSMVDSSQHPAVQELPDAELGNLVRLVRERRDKAQSLASQKRREMRGKGAARGAASAKRDEGSQVKLEVLAMAMRRLNGEVERRRRLAAQVALVENARKALSLKEKATTKPGAPDFNARHARQGMRSIENTKAGSLVRPMERGRLRKAAQVAQAKRDSR
jgi:hypothetical protein